MLLFWLHYYKDKWNASIIRTLDNSIVFWDEKSANPLSKLALLSRLKRYKGILGCDMKKVGDFICNIYYLNFDSSEIPDSVWNRASNKAEMGPAVLPYHLVVNNLNVKMLLLYYRS
jgi:hypothetical protein